VLELEAAAADPPVLLPLPLPPLPEVVAAAEVPVVDRVVGTAPGSLRVVVAESVEEAAPAESFSAPAVTVTGSM
jgi:hypothetical protein